MKHPLLIIGSGPAGLTAAIYAARAELSPLVFEGKAPGGQLMGTTEVENFPGFPDGILGPDLMKNMRNQAEKFGAKMIPETIERVDFSDPKNLRVFSESGEYNAESIIIATGASAKWLNLGKGEERFWGRGYSACATCDGPFFRNKSVAVVGGGDSACEEAEFLTRFASKVYLLVRTDQFRASKPMQKKVMENPKIEIQYFREVADLHGEKVLQSLTLKNNQTGELLPLEVQGLFSAIGHTPNTKIFSEFLPLQPNGYLQVIDGVKSVIPGVFIAGDCSDWKYRQAVSAAGMGCVAALEAERFLTGN